MKYQNFLAMTLIVLFTPTAYAATAIPFTVNMSEAVNVTGCPSNCPRIVLDVGGNTPRYADYTSGSGTSALTFTYAAQEGDVDLDGITITSNSIDLNTSGTIKDLNGNDLSPLTFTIPNTSGVKIDYPSLSMDFENSDYILSGTHYATLPSFLSAAGGTFTRASVGTYFDSSGTLQTAAADIPRFDHDPVTLVPKGILIEEQRTNLGTYSSQLQISTNLSQATIQPDTATAPDGTSSADKMIATASASPHSFEKFPNYANNSTYTQSFYAKAAEYTKIRVLSIGLGNSAGQDGTYDLATGTKTAGTGTITAIGNGWYRITETISTGNPSTSPGIRIYILDSSGATTFTGDGSSGVYLWGAQFEIGAFPTSYIPTTTVAVTRAADDLSLGSNTLLKQSAWSAVAKTYGMPSGSGGAFLGRSSNIGFGALNGQYGSYRALSSNGITNLAKTVNSTYYGDIAKSSIGVDTAGRSVTANGLVPSSDSVNITAASSSWGRIGSGAGISYLNAHMQNLKIYNKRLSDTQLQLLTQ
ncbi:MAG: hypothetical protein PHX61_05640 [Alphaproteobacteria bacterium]|nr:hypothetical protein [Alphaproteobacteria bacterium]